MRKILILIAIAVLGFKVMPALAQIPYNADFQVSGNLGISSSSTACSTGYAAFCPSNHTCKCLTASQASLHNASGGSITIPPGVTTVDVAKDVTDVTNTPPGGCFPAYADVNYVSTDGTAHATINIFATLCKPVVAGGPLSFSGGGAIEQATLIDVFPITVTGWGTLTGTYAPTSTSGQNLTLDLMASGNVLF